MNCHPDLQVDAQVEGGEAGERHDVHHHQVHPRDVDTEIEMRAWLESECCNTVNAV